MSGACNNFDHSSNKIYIHTQKHPVRILPFLFLMLGFLAAAQDPMRFEDDIRALESKYDTLWDPSIKETIVFTGSSSIRLWRNLPELFPGHQIVNTGFGGSETSDLLAYTEELVLRFHPGKVFIYEGDNDINARKKPRHILKDAEEVIRRIRANDSNTRIVLIAAKPSISRWHLRRRYRKLNRKLYRICKKDPALDFADVWEAMLDHGKLRKDVFIEDGLHMNNKGYQLWYNIIKEYIN